MDLTQLTTQTFLIFALLLILQNFSFTVVSRARNSGSDWFHAGAAVFSNGIWVIVNFFLFQGWDKVMEQDSNALLFGLAAFYVAFTVIGSILGGKISRRFFESGKRKVGHYEQNEARIKGLEAELSAALGRIYQLEKLHRDPADKYAVNV